MPLIKSDHPTIAANRSSLRRPDYFLTSSLAMFAARVRTV